MATAKKTTKKHATGDKEKVVKYKKMLSLTARDLELAKLAKGGVPAKPKKPKASASAIVVNSFIEKHNAFVKVVKSQAKKGKAIQSMQNALGSIKGRIKKLPY